MQQMLPSTKTAIDAILGTDPSVTPERRKEIMRFALAAPEQVITAMPRIIRREEAARLLGVGVKRVDQLSRAGILKRITVPGTTRAIGISEASVRAITEVSAA